MEWQRLFGGAAVVACLALAQGAAAQEAQPATEYGQEPQSPQALPPEPTPGEPAIEGNGTTLSTEELRTLNLTVNNVDRLNNRIYFEAQLDPRAPVEREGQQVSVNALQPGDSVRASFDPSTGEVERVEVLTPAQPGVQQPQQQPVTPQAAPPSAPSIPPESPAAPSTPPSPSEPSGY